MSKARDALRVLVFECSVAYAHALQAGRSTQEAELERAAVFKRGIGEPIIDTMIQRFDDE